MADEGQERDRIASTAATPGNEGPCPNSASQTTDTQDLESSVQSEPQTEAMQHAGSSRISGSTAGESSDSAGACGGPTLSDLGLGDSTEMHTVVPLLWCPHLSEVTPLPSTDAMNIRSPCVECGNVGENWVCLTCYEVHCSRYVNEHMLFHGLETGHKVVLSYADLSVWCYGCDAYVHNAILFEAKRAMHISKFGQDVPHQ